MNCAPFDVYAIRYARHSGRIAADNYLGKVDFHDAESDLDYYVWALRRGDERRPYLQHSDGRGPTRRRRPPSRRRLLAMTPLIGKPAPLFTAESTIGPVSLDQCQGRAVVLYFYPKDNTPGCTTESQDFRDLYEDFLAASTIVLGVSRDSLKSHENFKTKYELPFPLISDADETVCNLYGVIKQKNMYGKQVRGIERSTFLIDAYGVLVQEWRGVKVPGHAKEVLQAAKSIG